VTGIDPASAPFVLFASVEGEGADTNLATVAANGKLTGLKAALEKAGVASSSIQLTSFHVYPHFAQPPTDPPTITKHEAHIGIQVAVIGLEKVGVVINAALSAGAASVSTSIAGTSGPSSSDVATAVSEAIGQARTLATAAAASAGVRLGRLISIEIKPASFGSAAATVLVGADLAGYRGVRSTDGQAIEAVATYEALP
jgi:uncharacterized protein YggE